MHFVFVLLCVSLIYSSHGSTLDLHSVEEGACIIPPVESSLDLLWLSNIAEFYYPIIHKYALFNYAITLSGYDPKNITEEMAYNICLTLYPRGETAGLMTGFKGVGRANIDALITDHGMFDWIEKKTDGTLGLRGRTYVTLTDNKNYVMSVVCYETENQKSYLVAANVKTLDEKSKTDIKNHLKELGFNPNNLYEPKYDNCYDLYKPQNDSSSGNFTKEPQTYLTTSTESGNNFKPKPFLPQYTRRYFPDFTTVQTNFDNVGKPEQPQPPKSVLPVNKVDVETTKYNYETANKPYENNSPPQPSGNRTKDSIEMFFNIFRTAIDFMQNFYKNTVRYIMIAVTRVIGRFNTATRPST